MKGVSSGQCHSRLLAPIANCASTSGAGLKFTKRDHPFPKGAADAPTQAQALAATYHAAVRAGLDTSSSNSSASPTSASTHAHESEDLGTDFHTITDGPTKGTDKTGQPTRKKGKPTDSSVEEHNRREFEEAKSEDDKRRRKAQAEGWTAESIERTFGDRYAQVRLIDSLSGRSHQPIFIEH